MITPKHAHDIEVLQRELAIGNGSLVEFAQQFAVDVDNCGCGKDLFTFDRLTHGEADTVIEQLRMIQRLERDRRLVDRVISRELASSR